MECDEVDLNLISNLPPVNEIIIEEIRNKPEIYDASHMLYTKDRRKHCFIRGCEIIFEKLRENIEGKFS